MDPGRFLRLACRAPMLRVPLLAVLVVLVAGCASMRPEAPRGPSLQEQVEAAIAGFDGTGFGGTVGVYAERLGTGERVAINADTLFPTASMIKVPILVATFDAIARGDLAYDQTLVYRDSLAYPGGDLTAQLRDSSRVPLSEAVMLMLTMSDNTASLWLQRLVGGAAVNEALQRRGFAHTRVNSRTPGREADRERFGWGQTTPREMARLVTLIRRGEAVAPGADEEMYRAMTRSYWNDEALSALPPWVQAASKQGAVDRSRSEVLLVNAPHGDYVLCVITKNQTDTTYEADNAGYRLLRTLSALVWNHFEPDASWAPPAGPRY